MDLPLYGSLFLIVLLLYWSAWISSAETALFSLPSHKINSYKGDKDARKRLIARFLSKPRDLLVTIFMINTGVNIFLQNVMSDMFGDHGSWQYKVGIPLVLTLILGEIIPKYIGLQNNLSIAYKIAPTLSKVHEALRGVRRWVIAITAPLSKIMFFYLKKADNISKEEIEYILKTSEKQGVLFPEETELLAGFLNLQDCQVKELMQPKEDIIYYEISQPLSKLVHLFVEEECTRIPVCDKNLENMLGIISVMQFLKIQNPTSAKIIKALQKPFYVPETTSARLLLKRMDEQGEVLGIVVDEYGSITGLISREDLIEVVVGQIEDSRDSQVFYLKAGKNEVIASGKWELSELNHHFNTSLESPNNMVTVGGWLTEQIGDIPKSGTKWEFHHLLFHVLAASSTRINRLFIKKITPK